VILHFYPFCLSPIGEFDLALILLLLEVEIHIEEEYLPRAFYARNHSFSAIPIGAEKKSKPWCYNTTFTLLVSTISHQHLINSLTSKDAATNFLV
jgi:hypothetical protein